MGFYPNDGFANDIVTKKCDVEGCNDNFDAMTRLISQELKPWQERYTWYRVKSTDITPTQIPDGHLDAVFIDGDHS